MWRDSTCEHDFGRGPKRRRTPRGDRFGDVRCASLQPGGLHDSSVKLLIGLSTSRGVIPPRPDEAAARDRGLLSRPHRHESADRSRRKDGPVLGHDAGRERQQHEDRVVHACRRTALRQPSRGETAAGGRGGRGGGGVAGAVNRPSRVRTASGRSGRRKSRRRRPDPKYASEFEKRHQERFKGVTFDWKDFQRDGAAFPVAEPRGARPALQVLLQPAGEGSARRRSSTWICGPANLTWHPDGQLIAFTADADFRDELKYDHPIC